MKDFLLNEKRKMLFWRTSFFICILVLVAMSYILFNVTEKIIIQNTQMTAQDTRFLASFAKANAIAFSVFSIAISLKMQFFSVFRRLCQGKSAAKPVLFDNSDDFCLSANSDDKQTELAKVITLYLSAKDAGELFLTIYPLIEAVYVYSYILLFIATTSNPAFIFIGMLALTVSHSIYLKLRSVYVNTQIDKTLEELFVFINFYRTRLGKPTA